MTLGLRIQFTLFLLVLGVGWGTNQMQVIYILTDLKVRSFFEKAFSAT